LGEGYCCTGRTILPLPVLTPQSHPLTQDPPQLVHDPETTRHIVAAIMLVSPFPTLKPGIYWARGTVEQGEPPSFTRLDPPDTSSTTRSPTDGARPRGHEAYSVGDYARPPFFDPQTWDIVGEGWENHPPFTRLDPTGTSSTARSPKVGARPRAHETYRVGDYVPSPRLDPQILDILGEGYC